MGRIVVLADHDETSQAHLSQTLTKAGYEVIAVDTARQVIDVLLSQGVALVVASFNLPDMDGVALAKTIASHEGVGITYTILLTEKSDENRLQEAFSAGAADCLRRPIDDSVLIARMRTGERMLAMEQDLEHKALEVTRANAEMAVANQELSLANRKLSHAVRTDELTRLPNRRAAMSRLRECWSFSTRHNYPLSCIVIDIDRFKLFNDTYGHLIGDLVLKEVAKTLQATARCEDTVSRVGGEEFLIICPHSSAKEAAIGAERLRRAIEALVVKHHGRELKITISVGVAEQHSNMTNPEELLKAADRAMYDAKIAGRNCVRLSDTDARSNLEAMLGTTCHLPNIKSAGAVLLLGKPSSSAKQFETCVKAAGYQISHDDISSNTIESLIKTPVDIVVINVDPLTAETMEIVRKIRANMTTHGISIAMLGTKPSEEALRTILAADVDDYISVPFEQGETAMRLRNLIALSRSRNELASSTEHRGEQARMLTLLIEYSRALVSAADQRTIIDHTLSTIAELTSSRRASIMLPDIEQEYLVIAKSIGVPNELKSQIRVKIGSGVAGKVYSTGKSVVVNSEGHNHRSSERYQSEFFACLPMICRSTDRTESIVGVLSVTERHSSRVFDPGELEFLDLISSMAAGAIYEIQLRNTREQARDGAVTAMAKLAEQRDGNTGRHLDRVSQLCSILAKELKTDSPYADQITDQFLHNLSRAVPLHDIGKVGIPDDVLLKQGKHGDDETQVMRRHVEIGRDTIRSLRKKVPGVGFLRMAEEVAHSHHEWYDGTGYPQGLEGDQIPLAARIAALADVYDALVSKRVYKDPSSHKQAIALIRERSGTHFDPVIVDAFMNCLKQFADACDSQSDLRDSFDESDDGIRSVA
ncbi:MAG: diguanylate cyclase [Planctomycetes bacterium]|nr:diguanylate cyclase [Planctomycetota bacterium]